MGRAEASETSPDIRDWVKSWARIPSSKAMIYDIIRCNIECLKTRTFHGYTDQRIKCRLNSRILFLCDSKRYIIPSFFQKILIKMEPYKGILNYIDGNSSSTNSDFTWAFIISAKCLRKCSISNGSSN